MSSPLTAGRVPQPAPSYLPPPVWADRSPGSRRPRTHSRYCGFFLFFFFQNILSDDLFPFVQLVTERTMEEKWWLSPVSLWEAVLSYRIQSNISECIRTRSFQLYWVAYFWYDISSQRPEWEAFASLIIIIIIKESAGIRRGYWPHCDMKDKRDVQKRQQILSAMKQISVLLLYWLLIIFVSAPKHTENCIFFSSVLLLLSGYFLDPLSWCRDALLGNLGFVVPRRKKSETLFAYISVNPFAGLLEQRCCTSPRLWDVPDSTRGSERPTAANSSTDQTAGPFTFCYLFFWLFWLFWMEINANMSAQAFLSQLCPLKCRLDIGLLLATYQTL